MAKVMKSNAFSRIALGVAASLVVVGYTRETQRTIADEAESARLEDWKPPPQSSPRRTSATSTISRSNDGARWSITPRSFRLRLFPI